MKTDTDLSQLQPLAIYLADVSPVSDAQRLAHYCRQCENALDEVNAARRAVAAAKRGGVRRELSTAQSSLIFWSRSARSWRDLVTKTRGLSGLHDDNRRTFGAEF
jgi:HPt (histidine-containing phosphotransfer) domain-containing protein